MRGHDASQLPYEFLHPFIRGTPSDDHRPRHSFFIGIGGLGRRRVAFFSFRLDLLLLRLVLRRRGGAVGLGLRARLFSAAASARHGGCSLLFASSVVAVQLWCSSCADCRLCSCCCVARVGSRLAAAMAHLCWSTRGRKIVRINAQRWLTKGKRQAASPLKMSRLVIFSCCQNLSGGSGRRLGSNGKRGF